MQQVEEEFTQILDIEDESSDDDQLSFTELYKSLLQHRDITVTINADDFNRLKTGLTQEKYESNQKAKKASIEYEKQPIEYSVLESGEEGTAKIRIRFTPRRSIRLLGIEPTNNKSEG